MQLLNRTKAIRTFFGLQFFALCVLLPSSGIPHSKLDVSYIEYPPYYYNDNGKPKGVLLEKAVSVLQCARIEFSLNELPSNRAIDAVKLGTQAMSIGWFKTQERETFAKFSRPIYQNKPQAAVFKKERADDFAPYDTLSSLIVKSKLVLGVVAGHSEGKAVDDVIKKNPKNVYRVDAEQKNIISMLDAGRFDYILLPPEEFDNLVITHELDADAYMLKCLEDIPPGNMRYLMFSNDVSDRTVESVNDCIYTIEHIK
ncbi:substrate-binding periplasmic protein [Fundidesulfovibrio agrisoli]|uniref:substrate-binding periplasmic protein n=1 Tax=Fundidesulfovibrio agrisoli TaxID=2922717 RepID=UPI001FABD399|nr:transporter substrate-binding domain-containing protein [Fundidesulfovibrio agrisoli]